MRTFPTLVLAPALALADQSVAYAFVAWGCAHQGAAAVDIVHALFLAATLALSFLAWRDLRAATARAAGMAREGAPGDRRMIARAGLLLGLFSSLVIAAMWLPHWALSACATG